MTIHDMPWLELSIALPLVGAGAVGFVRRPLDASRWCLGFAGATLVVTLVSALGHFTGDAPAEGWNRRVLTVDDVNAPLLPLVALLHFLTALATARTKMPRFSFPGLLIGLSMRLAVSACVDPWPLVALLAAEACLPFAEIRRRGGSGRLFAIHAVAFVALLAGGWALTRDGAPAGSALLLAAVLVRTGGLPAQVWTIDTFASASFGGALLFATPFVGVTAAARLIMPVAPWWTLEALQVLALVAAGYCACRAVVENDGRRFFAFLVVSHGSLVLVGLGLDTPFAVTGAMVMWLSAALSLAGLGLTLRAVEARVGPLSLTTFRGLYDQSPSLAVCFLITGLAAVGFPGTSGFIAVELLVDEAVGAHETVGLAVVLIAAINGIAVVRTYFLLFTGRRHATGVDLTITPRERVAVLTLAALILGGGLLPMLYLESRQRAAAEITSPRDRLLRP